MYAIIFPGQGSQKIGMAVDFCAAYPVARAVFEEADDALGAPLSRWIEQGPEALLRRTEVTQPAILAASIAIYRVLEPRLPRRAPLCFAGHSLGEYSALVAAGALALGDALRLVQRRGQLMQEAVPEGEGAMAAVLGLSGERVAELLSNGAGSAAPANFNAPTQTVIAGRTTDIEAAEKRLADAGARRVVRLDVSAPFHCALMQSAMEQLTPLLKETPFSPARLPVISNVTAAPYWEPEQARERLREQVCAPVRWVESVQYMKRSGADVLLEVGQGKVLSGLTTRIEPSLGRAYLSSLDDLASAELAIAGQVA